MNEQNLKPMNQRTESEQREIAKKGGVKSGKARRRNRDIRNLFQVILKAEPDDPEIVARLKALGFEDNDITNKTAMSLAMMEKARTGDMKAFETIMKYAGEDPDQKRKDAELKIKREALKLQKQRYEAENETDIEDLSFLADMLKD